jgi:hypothetical protein
MCVLCREARPRVFEDPATTEVLFKVRTGATLVKAAEVSVIRVKSGVFLRFLDDSSMGITLLRENQGHVTCPDTLLIQANDSRQEQRLAPIPFTPPVGTGFLLPRWSQPRSTFSAQ